ncbi:MULTISPECIES: sensor histidine kinase [Pseudomonas]|uniref:histidine kinase n=2 Tax=Pseudomonas TaxID=286 RepID=A0ABD4Y9Z5_9PSED|nr:MULTISPECIES: PAS domain-containing protein [Pseudomonas]ESW39062.1 histidine kinase [Pseudomonas taiwanensis SJ9]KAF4557570.1 PAS domain-containing protein [Pseudomonas sp. CES]MDH0042768.1 PAS domain-containing protein [Pseudomonas juntendi]MDH0756044.1 PAS domain-containing protein [Pseudomonas juntendi]MDH1572575.1 PAS domain-containing protein [Pseudomonas sp. GD03746]
MEKLPLDETIRAALKKSYARLQKQHQLVVEFGVRALKASDLDVLLTESCVAVAQGMQTRYAKILVPLGEGDGFLLSHGVGWDEADIGSATVGADVASPAGYAISTYRPVLSNHLGQEHRFRTPELLKKYGIERAINVPIRGTLAPFGVLEADSTNGDDFIESDLVFLEGISNVISMAVERLAGDHADALPAPYSESILNASPDCVKILSIAGDIEFMNDAGMRLMHIGDLAQVKGQAWSSLWPDESIALVIEAVTKVVAGETTRFEAYCPTAADEPKWWDVTVAPILSQSGQVQQLIAVSRDVTERHQHEAELISLIETQNSKLNTSDLYMEEIHHRVKNSLHLVNTLLLLQANLTPDEAVKLQLETAAGRVVTIASVHERLYQTASKQDVLACDYLRALLGDLGKALADRTIVLDADAFVLPPERMAPLGLVISELITNALKYGKGTIEVVVREKDDHALITVSDEGEGFPENYPKASGTGLGMRLVKSYSGYGSTAITIDRAQTHSTIHVRFKL